MYMPVHMFMIFRKRKIYCKLTSDDNVMFFCLKFLSLSRNFHAYKDVIIADEGLPKSGPMLVTQTTEQ